jgi:ATP-dependent helicase/DNAse subunit B
LRELRLPEGRYEILQGIERAAQRVPRPERARELDEPTIDYGLAHRWLAWYAPLTERLHRARSLEGWLDLLAELLRELGVTRFDSDAGNAPDLVAWDQAQRLLRAAATAEARWRPTPRVLNLSEFLAEFRDLLADETAEPPPEPSGAIRILGAEQLRQLETPYLILADLNEESFPRHHRDDCLFTDHERRAFAAAGLPLRHAQRHQQDELLFFTQLVLTAQRHLVLTYPAVSRRGQPAYASPYLAALRGLWTDAAFPIEHVGSLDPVPQAEAAVSPTDLRLVAMEQALDGSAGWLRALGEAPETRAMVRNLVAAVEMQVHRFHTSGFTPYEGRLELARNHEQLAQRFHAGRQFSATELESLAACPFRFWLDTVLNVAPLPEVDTGTDLKRRGTVVHDVLAQLLDDQRPDAERDQLSSRFRELVGTALDRVYTESDLQAALLRVEGLVLSEWATAYVEQFGEYAEETQTAWAGAWRSLPPETPFGDVPRSADEATTPPLSVGAASQRVLIRGRIDRIDTGVVDGRPVFTVIDYKTGKRPSLKEADVHAGRSLQLVLYAMAARRLGLVPTDALPFQLGYWCLKETGFRGELGRKTSPAPVLDAAVWSALEQLLDETIPRLVQQIRAGQFVVDNPDEDCTSRCDYRTICRVQQLRPVAEVLGKRREPN